MTGFAVIPGQAEGLEWQWEARSVNSRGLDVRLRLPDGLEALETQVRKAAQAELTRGSVQVSLRLALDQAGGGLALNTAALETVLSLVAQAADAARSAGVPTAPMTLGDILSLRGVLDSTRTPDQAAAAASRIAEDIPKLFAALAEARAAEGVELSGILTRQIDQIAELTSAAADTAETRAARQGDTLRTRVQAIVGAQDGIEPGRLEQELALIAVKSDVTEELDRLTTHVAAARTLLAMEEAVGRRLDFLMQEFNREANTLCSKAQDSALTAIGLDLKVVIDQMREQCANVE